MVDAPQWLEQPTAEPVELVGDGVGIVSPGSAVPADGGCGQFEIRQVILRACKTCGGPSEATDTGATCKAGCGPCEIHDNGLIAAYYNPRAGSPAVRAARTAKAAWWRLHGRRAADRRIAASNN